jgi:hypothetical protein
MSFELDPSYKDVPARIVDFREKHPDGRLRPVDESRPYWIESIGDKTFIVYAAAAYKDKNDTLPGIGIAWEPFPGTTPYTKNSELQNAETSAWGRAIIAALASESRSIASAEDVRNRQAEASVPPPTPLEPSPEMKEAMKGLVDIINLTPEEERQALKDYLNTTYGDAKFMDLDTIHKAATVAAGWPGTRVDPTQDELL